MRLERANLIADRPGRAPQLRGSRGETAGARGGVEGQEPREIRKTHDGPDGVHTTMSASGWANFATRQQYFRANASKILGCSGQWINLLWPSTSHRYQ